MDATTTTSSSPGTSFVILSVTIVGILGTSLLLLAYYLFLTRCGLLFFWRAHDEDVAHHHHHHIHIVTASEPQPRRGLEDAAIRRIPTFRYRRANSSNDDAAKKQASECAVCLAEFRDGERLRLLPPCLHAFHIDCIDAWLQAAASCPLCRAAVSADSHLHHILGATSAATVAAGLQGRRDADIVIDIIDEAADHDDQPASTTSSPPDETALRKKNRTSSSIDARRARVRSGDQLEELRCLGVPAQQPMRRSLSMDSSSDKRFYLALQRILQQQQKLGSPAVREEGNGKGESSAASPGGSRSRRLRRSFLSFSQSRGSRSAVILPL